MLQLRACVLIAALSLLAVPAVAQEPPRGGGACSDYSVATSAGQAIVAGTVDIGNHGDDLSTPIALPFSFPFYGTPFVSVNAISNGNLQFTSNSTAFTNVCPIPTVTMNNAIYPYWDDLRTDAAGGGIFTSISGIAPNRIFNIEWRAVYFGLGGTANFEARLYETSGRIDFIYGTVAGGIASATGGLQLGTGPTIENLFCNGAGQAITSGLMVTYTCAGGACQLTCPSDQTVSTDPGLCSAVVNYPAPGTTGNCGPVTCTPPSGSVFQEGTTPVTCAEQLPTGLPEGLSNCCTAHGGVGCDDATCQAAVCAADSFCCNVAWDSICATEAVDTYCVALCQGGGGASCGFDVTVNDTEPPQITCPADIEIDIPPYSTGQNVDYDPPGTSDNCYVDSVDCQPPSGGVFPAGTTPVNCVAYDGAGNSANCSFQIILNSVSVLEIPTMSKLGLAALALLLAGAALLVFRKNG